MKKNEKNGLPENSDNYDNKNAKNNIKECKFCFKLGCDGTCIKKDVSEIIEKDNSLINKEKLLDNQPIFASKNYSHEINKIKNQILELLSAVDFKSVNGEYLTNLGSDLVDFGILIGLGESLTLGNNDGLNDNCFNINYNPFGTSVPQNAYVKTLKDFESDFVFLQEKTEYIIKLFIKNLSKYSGKKIVERGEVLRKTGEQMQMTEINMEFCKIVKGV